MIQDIFFGECKHDLFPYRPYRRGKYRCKVCGGRIPLSPLGKRFRDLMIDKVLKHNPFMRFIARKAG